MRHGGFGPQAMVIGTVRPSEISGRADQCFIISNQRKRALIRVFVADASKSAGPYQQRRIIVLIFHVGLAADEPGLIKDAA